MNKLDFTQILVKGMPKAGPFGDIIISCRARMIRNIYGIPFSHRQNENDVRAVTGAAEKFVGESSYKGLELIKVNTLDCNSKRFLRERNIISPAMEAEGNTSVIISGNDDFVIMINDGDHFKIQVTKPGLELNEAYDSADRIDNELNRFAIYAFSEDIGYITSNPYGGGLEFSTTLHLPVLYFTKRMQEAQDIVKLSRLNIEGIKEEGLKTFGSLFILTNAISAGMPERETMEDIDKITRKIIDLESGAREDYIAEHSLRLEDKICRSYGLLRHARRIGYVEAMDYLSDIRLGVILSVVKNIELQKINDLMIKIQWSHLQKIADRIFPDTSEGDTFRASYLRDQLEWSSVYG